MYSENSKIVILLDSFSKQIQKVWVIFRIISSIFETTANLQYLPLAPFARSYRVTDEGFSAET